MGPIAYSDLLLMNDIRNAFAHSLFDLSFANEHIRVDCRSLRFHLNFYEPHGLEYQQRDDARDTFLYVSTCLYVAITGHALTLEYGRSERQLDFDTLV